MDPTPWPLIVQQYTALVWQTIYRLLPHPEDAADCYQETFTSAWHLSLRQPIRNWPGLLQRLATARALDHLRRRHRCRSRHETIPDLAELPSAHIDPLTAAQHLELAHHLRHALATLPPKQSQAYCLRHLNDFSYQQIADELGMTLSAVGVNLQRAAQRLRIALAPIQLLETKETQS